MGKSVSRTSTNALGTYQQPPEVGYKGSNESILKDQTEGEKYLYLLKLNQEAIAKEIDIKIFSAMEQSQSRSIITSMRMDSTRALIAVQLETTLACVS